MSVRYICGFMSLSVHHLCIIGRQEAKSRAGFTALMEAACKGHTAVLQLLIDDRADIEAKRPGGKV